MLCAKIKLRFKNVSDQIGNTSKFMAFLLGYVVFYRPPTISLADATLAWRVLSEPAGIAFYSNIQPHTFLISDTIYYVKTNQSD